MDSNIDSKPCADDHSSPLSPRQVLFNVRQMKGFDRDDRVL